ncbi:RDD family protein [Halobacteriovorax marinus]|uniref:RDD family protein n=1 Tax=Halobacteriovorax marinus TaxID=97084 RepID=UPI003A9380FE
MSDEKDDWNFSLDDEAPAKKKKKKITNKPLLKNSKKEVKIDLDAGSVPRKKSRRQMAREAGGTSIKDRDIVDPAPNWKRGIAFIIDLALLIVIVAAGQAGVVFYPEFGETFKTILGPEIINSIPLDIGGIVIALVIHFLIVVIPQASTQKSLGKKILKLKVIGTLKAKAPLGVLIVREYFAKPIAIVSVIGIVMIPLNRRRRGLHDYISGTVVLDNS